MIGVDIRGDLRPLHRAMVALGAKQVPFAMSLALNSLAKGVAADQIELIDETFDTPTPFTKKAYRIEVATKSQPIALVAAKDIQAEYLEPYVTGGQRSYGKKKGMLAPRSVGLNQYGNLTKGKMASLQGKPGVFIGPVTTRGGKVIKGVWQRSGPKAGGKRSRAGGQPRRGALKLLIQFEDTTEVPKRLDFYGRAQAYLKANAAREFEAGLRRALATSRA